MFKEFLKIPKEIWRKVGKRKSELREMHFIVVNRLAEMSIISVLGEEE